MNSKEDDNADLERQARRPKARRISKPKKPYKDFPLFAHATGRWAKKITGKMYYFGSWDDPQAALRKYLEQRDDLHAGRRPQASAVGLTLVNLVNRFLTAKMQRVDSGELRQRTFSDLKSTCDTVLRVIGKRIEVNSLRPDDFEKLRADLASRLGPQRLTSEIKRVRSLFAYAKRNDLIEKDVKYGASFDRPNRRTMRLHRQASGKNIFTAEEIHKLLEQANTTMQAAILLGINCGMGSADLGQMPLRALDLDAGWIDFPRPKTAVERRCPLWPETVRAIRSYLKTRPNAKDPEHAGLVFVTRSGGCYHKQMEDSPFKKQMGQLMKRSQITGRSGRGMYTLRHCFSTVGAATLDQIAVDFIMGHADNSVRGTYREEISDERLQAVVNHVRAWLYAVSSPKKTE